jgi:hypothetical protein
MQFDSDVPKDFEDALDAWRTYIKGRKAAIGKL